MYYAVVGFPPKNDTKELENFRKKFDSQYELIPAHVTFIFPISSSGISELDLLKEVSSRVAGTRSFSARFDSTKLSWDRFLFLVPSRGYKEIIDIHDQLYSGRLKEFLREDLPFEPHISLGQFAEGHYDIKDPKRVSLDEDRLSYAQEYLDLDKLKLEYEINEISIIAINDDFSKITIIKRIDLIDKEEK